MTYAMTGVISSPTSDLRYMFVMSLNTLKNKINNMSSYKDTGEKSDESTSNASASFTCEQCGKTFNSRQELKEHTH
jgi:transposase-like protein